MPRIIRQRQQPRRHVDDDEHGNDKGADPPQRPAEHAGEDLLGVARKVGDIEPEIVQALVPAEPNATRAETDHQRVHDPDAAENVHRVQRELPPRRHRVELGERRHEQHQRKQKRRHARPIDLADRDQKLRIQRLGQRKVESPAAHQFAEFLGVGHEEHLDEAVDEVRCRDKDKKLILPPPAIDADLGRVLEHEPIEPKVHDDPRERRDALDDKVAAKRQLANEAVFRKRAEDGSVVSGSGHRSILAPGQ